MNILMPVKPSATFSELYPPQTVYAPRSTRELMRWVLDDAFRLDTITGVTLTIMGDMPLICHQSTATPLILDFFRKAGIEPTTNLTTFETEEEAIAVAREYIGRGKKLAYTFPPPLDLHAPGSLLVTLSLYNWLNDKANLAQLVDNDYLPRYQIVQTDCLSRLYDFLPGRDVFIKACYPGVTGGGKDVRYCPDQTSRRATLDWLDACKDGLSGVRIEEALDIKDCWCLSLSILEFGTRYLGAATQLFTEPAKQSGSRIDPDHLPPDSVVVIAKAIAERTRIMGYRGLAGFDMGTTLSGQVFVFDLNFRLASSTPQILLHEAAISRVDARISQSWNNQFTGRLSPVLERIAEFSQSGKFVPVRLYEATQISGGQSVITGIVVGKTLTDIEKISAGMHAALSNLTDH
jgi:hypothetical protein